MPTQGGSIGVAIAITIIALVVGALISASILGF